MKKNAFVFLSALTLLGFAFSVTNSKSEAIVRDKEIIVELKDIYGTDLNSRNKVENIFKNELLSVVGFNYRIKNNYKSMTNALVIEVNSDDVESIKNLNVVENYKEVETYTYRNDDASYSFDPVKSENIAPDKNYSRIEMNVPTTSEDGKNTLVAILDDSFNINHEIFKDLSSDYRYTKEEITSLTNSTGFHSKGWAYKNNKIPYYYSYGTNNTEMSYTNNSTYHGQHVAGIAGGNNNYSGIAPNAQLALMKVTDGTGSFGSDTVILNALEDCSLLDVDAINMSFGVAIDDFVLSTLYDSIFEKMEEKGISINMSTGNDGREQFYEYAYKNSLTSSVEDGIAGGYGLSNYATSVASLNLQNDVSIDSSLATASGKSFRSLDQITNHSYYENQVSKKTNYDTVYPFYSLIESGKTTTTLDYVVVPNYGLDEDYNNIDVNGKVAVVQRGGATGDNDPNVALYSFVAKVTNAVKHGAKAVIIYNNDTATDRVKYFDLTKLGVSYYVPIANVDSAAGELLKSETNKQIVVGKEIVSDYTSDGSTSTLQIKPDISAPGTNVWSSIGPGTSSYAYYSGTSMAAPNYTGSVANILSNYDYVADETKRLEYRKSLTSRIMSTADPIELTNGAYASPRMVGAGAVDVSDAINSDVYLEGNVQNKAKVELKNTDDIKVGNVKFSVTTHNDSGSAKKYKATLYVQAPELTSIDATFKDLASVKYKTNKDVLLTKATSEVTIAPGDSSIDFSTSITSDNKEYLKSFENGTYLEGYVILEAVDGGVDLSIPYMGFYGDFADADCVEPFDFEKEEGKVYGSDVLNEMVSSAGNSTADYSSMIVTLGRDLTKDEYSAITKNKASFTNYGKLATYDAENNEYVLGAKGISDRFIIQQFVNRSVADNKITVTSKETGKVVYTDAMFSFLNSVSGDTKHPLYRSEATVSLFNDDYFADRAYTVISLVDDSGNLKYPEGTYEWKFEYTLPSGIVQTKTINIKIGVSALQLANVDFDDSRISLQFDGDIKDVYYDGLLAETEVLNNETYFYIDLSKVKDKKSIYVLANNTNGTSLSGLIDDVNYIGVFSADLTSKHSLSVTKTSLDNVFESGDGYRYKVSIFNGSGIKITTPSDATFVVSSNSDSTSETITIYNVNGTLLTEVASSTVGNSSIFSLATSDFAVNYVGSSSGSSFTFNPILVIVLCVCFVLVVAIVVFGTTTIKRKHKKL